MPDRTFQVPKRAMAIFAHPDDVDFGCSGTLASWIERGTHVTYCVITSGQKGTWDPKLTGAEMAKVRERDLVGRAPRQVQRAVLDRRPILDVEARNPVVELVEEVERRPARSRPAREGAAKWRRYAVRPESSTSFRRTPGLRWSIGASATRAPSSRRSRCA